MSDILAVALAGAAGGVTILCAVTVLVVLCLRHRRRTSDSSESNSSGQALPDMQGARCMTLQELRSATNNFSCSNLIGSGMFGEVFNGLLQDGTIIAVKKRHSPPSQEFIHEVNYLSSIRHRNLVKLLGYCQDNDMQMLVYEYVPNGSVSTHLHGNGRSPTVQNFQESSDISAITDSRMINVFTSQGMKELLRLASWCVNPMGEHRPPMNLVEAEIHRIREQEIRLTTFMSEATATVTLGSQLFTASR
uniref:Uncharacterized protein n=1 Tax=Avena sativa TaxID=4498 RepID=A0ACD5XCP9_AVESA